MSHSAWQERLKRIIGPAGYQPYMRRSMQTIVMFEAMRCMAPRVAMLRPFQKRALLLNIVYNILRGIDFMTAPDKEAVLWKTQRSREQLDGVTAWKRGKIIQRDLNKLLLEIPRYMAPGRPYDVAVDMMVQAMFNSLNGINEAPAIDTRLAAVPSPQWEYLHNHALLTLRVYYHGDTIDPSLPDPVISPFKLPIPNQRPPSDESPRYQTFRDTRNIKNQAQNANRIDANALILTVRPSAPTSAIPTLNPVANPSVTSTTAALLPPVGAMHPLQPVASAAASFYDPQQQVVNIPTLLSFNILPQVFAQENAAAAANILAVISACYAAVTASNPSLAVNSSLTASNTSSVLGRDSIMPMCPYIYPQASAHSVIAAAAAATMRPDNYAAPANASSLSDLSQFNISFADAGGAASLQSMLQANEQIEMLERLQGVMSEDELNSRKRKLYQVLASKLEGGRTGSEEGTADDEPQTKKPAARRR